MTGPRPTALIADDEPLLRKSLTRLLAQAWPELNVVAQARNGREAVEQFEALQPGICFLDVHMPGLSGVEAARCIGRRAHLVFVTAFDQYALQAFEQGALDYLVKPVEPAQFRKARHVLHLLSVVGVVLVGKDPAHMRPPKTALQWRMNILLEVRMTMMLPVLCRPPQDAFLP